MEPYAVEIRALVKRYRRHLAVDSLDLLVRRGTVFGFLGPNGAGKTTTIMTLLGNIRATQGSATLLGRPVGDREARRRVGFLPEKFQFHGFLTARELLRLHGSLCGMSEPAMARRIPECLELVGLAERANSRVREFSKGMQQRLGFAQAIIHDPELVILDEPTSALDPIGRRDMREVIAELKRRGATVLLNSHILSEVERTCDEVAILNRGRIIAAGNLEELLRAEARVEVVARGLSERGWQEVLRLCPRTERNGDRLVAHTQDESVVPALARAVVEDGAELVHLSRERRSLEELFVKAVGET